MTAEALDRQAFLLDALLAARLFVTDPGLLGGLAIRAHAGPVRDAYLDFIRESMPLGTAFRKLPLHIHDERLFGGLDLSATLHQGRPVFSAGLLAEVNAGVLVVPMAERMSTALAGRIASTMDQGLIRVERDGLSVEAPARFGILLLDEHVADDEQVSDVLLDRMAFRVDLSEVSLREMTDAITFFDEEAEARSTAPTALVSDEITRALCGTAMSLGILSIRAAIFARRVTALSAARAGRDTATQEDAEVAARLVLAPQALTLPVPPESPEPDPPEDRDDPPPPTESTDDEPKQDTEPSPEDLENLEDVVLEAARAAIPAGLLAQLLSDQQRLRHSSGSGKSGAEKKRSHRGRPLGSRQGLPRGQARLSVIDTLRAAAPWQTIRRRAQTAARRLHIRTEDFRIKRFKDRSETTTIFVVDASGSSAIHRLAEAKGAVELLLADCYVRRDQVAVIAFRGQKAEVILPPTRSLVRAKRGLSGLPGGGGTPLATAIEASLDLALSIARKGETPVIVMLTDGKANIGRDGSPGREQARNDAHAAAKLIATAGLPVMLIDTSPQPSVAAQEIAAAMHARYMPLPHAGAMQVSQVVKAMV
jgi:magnesium chelatase subunit D